MKTLLMALAISFVTVIATYAQEAPAQEIKLLQEQLATIIKARGEDQRQILALQEQLKTIQQPKETPEQTRNRVRSSYETFCKERGMKVDRVVYSFSENGTRTLLDSISCRK